MEAPNYSTETYGVGRITVNKHMAATICATAQRRFAELFLIKLIKWIVKFVFEMSSIAVEAICGRCANFMILTPTVSEIFGGQTNSSNLVVDIDNLMLL